MKNTMLQLFTGFLLAAFAASPDTLGQGTIAANNINGIFLPHATNFGIFFDIDFVPYSATPINVTILGGPNANSLSHIVTLAGPNALVAVALGRYNDPSGGIYAIPGVAPGQLATLQVLAWRGSAATFGQANVAEDIFSPFGGTSFFPPTLFTFTNPTGDVTPASLDGMPAMLRILDVPEPGVFVMLAFGALLLGWRLRRARKP